MQINDKSKLYVINDISKSNKNDKRCYIKMFKKYRNSHKVTFLGI